MQEAEERCIPQAPKTRPPEVCPRERLLLPYPLSSSLLLSPPLSSSLLLSPPLSSSLLLSPPLSSSLLLSPPLSSPHPPPRAAVNALCKIQRVGHSIPAMLALDSMLSMSISTRFSRRSAQAKITRLLTLRRSIASFRRWKEATQERKSMKLQGQALLYDFWADKVSLAFASWKRQCEKVRRVAGSNLGPHTSRLCSPEGRAFHRWCKYVYQRRTGARDEDEDEDEDGKIDSVRGQSLNPEKVPAEEEGLAAHASQEEEDETLKGLMRS
eukprot:768030-Hanusia_phi.AAC.5